MRFWKRWFRGKGEPGGTGAYGVDSSGVSEMLRFNRNLLEALRHERSGIEL